MQWVLGAFSHGVKLPGHEADRSPATSAEVKKTRIYTSTPPYAFMAKCVLSYVFSLFFLPRTSTLVINYWVMHPVARVSINIYRNLRTQQMSLLLVAIFRWFVLQKIRSMSHWPRGTLYSQKLALTSLTSGGRSVGIVRSRTQATEFSLVSYCIC
jgi:hypothetical protein